MGTPSLQHQDEDGDTQDPAPNSCLASLALLQYQRGEAEAGSGDGFRFPHGKLSQYRTSKLRTGADYHLILGVSV